MDLTAFDFDETLLEQGWTPTDTPQLPARYFFSLFTSVLGSLCSRGGQARRSIVVGLEIVVLLTAIVLFP